jgi:ribosomal protein S18 acetylase RimI-like enzyme
VAVTLERDGSPLAAEVRAQGVTVRPARPADQEPVAALAGRVFRWSRFHRDPRIPRSVADRIKAQWVRGFFAGTRGSALSVAVRRGQVVGFLLALEPEPGLCVIDLIGVEQAERGCGLAVLLTEHARRRGAGIERMRVGTQLSNLPALRAYLRMGFQIVASHQVLHRHGPAGRRARATPKAALAAGA